MKRSRHVLRDLVPFVRFTKREKHQWRSVTLSKVAGFSLQVHLKYNSPMGIFHVF